MNQWQKAYVHSKQKNTYFHIPWLTLSDNIFAYPKNFYADAV